MSTWMIYGLIIFMVGVVLEWVAGRMNNSNQYVGFVSLVGAIVFVIAWLLTVIH